MIINECEINEALKKCNKNEIQCEMLLKMIKLPKSNDEIDDNTSEKKILFKINFLYIIIIFFGGQI